MSDDDLRAALAVYAAEVKPEEYEHLPDHERNRFKALHHMFTRLLQLLPPTDDGELVSVQWFRDAGAEIQNHSHGYVWCSLKAGVTTQEYSEGDFGPVVLEFGFRDDGAVFDAAIATYRHEESRLVPDGPDINIADRTRGNVRRLAASLGIQLKGGA